MATPLMRRWRAARGPRRFDERGAAVVDFVLVLMVLVPLVLGIVQVGLVLHVRNTLAAAAADGARLAATDGGGTAAGRARAQEQIFDSLAGRFARDVQVQEVTVDGVREMQVTVRAEVPALGLGGPAVSLQVAGHAVEEQP